MEEREFSDWLLRFRNSIASYDYYVDFEKVYRNIDKIKVELNILNSLIGSKDIERDFLDILEKYPETLKCIPILLAVREREIFAVDADGEFDYSFKNKNQTNEQYAMFMRKTGLFELIENRIVNNLFDYVTGVETGLNSNGRKNRGGHLMENKLEEFIVEAGFEKDINYFKEMKTTEISKKWNIDLANITNKGKTIKRFDFVIKTENMIYGIEANFYASAGSKLNETARSYKNLAKESMEIDGFTFIWFTDGNGWISARNNLAETFEAMEHVYNIDELEMGIINKIFI